MRHLDLSCQVRFDRLHFFELGRAAGGAGGVFDVEKQERAAAVEFEIEIAFAFYWFDEELNTTIAADWVEIIGVNAFDVTIFDAEEDVQRLFIVKHARFDLRAMIGASSKEIGNGKRLGVFPRGRIPI